MADALDRRGETVILTHAMIDRWEGAGGQFSRRTWYEKYKNKIIKSHGRIYCCKESTKIFNQQIETWQFDNCFLSYFMLELPIWGKWNIPVSILWFIGWSLASPSSLMYPGGGVSIVTGEGKILMRWNGYLVIMNTICISTHDRYTNLVCSYLEARSPQESLCSQVWNECSHPMGAVLSEFPSVLAQGQVAELEERWRKDSSMPHKIQKKWHLHKT